MRSFELGSQCFQMLAVSGSQWHAAPAEEDDCSKPKETSKSSQELQG